MEPEDFPWWRDEQCPHPKDRQKKDGQGVVCLDCGVLRVTWQ